MTEWTIEKGVPIPARDYARKTGATKGLIAVMRRMEMADSVLVPHERGGTATAQAVISHVTEETGHRFSRRMVDGGCRVWRVA